MQHYLNLSGRSGIYMYEIKDDAIIVEFANPSKRSGSKTYNYTYSKAGAGNVEKMKELALAGVGLNNYIDRHVSKRYESKW